MTSPSLSSCASDTSLLDLECIWGQVRVLACSGHSCRLPSVSACCGPPALCESKFCRSCLFLLAAKASCSGGESENLPASSSSRSVSNLLQGMLSDSSCSIRPHNIRTPWEEGVFAEKTERMRPFPYQKFCLPVSRATCRRHHPLSLRPRPQPVLKTIEWYITTWHWPCTQSGSWNPLMTR